LNIFCAAAAIFSSSDSWSILTGIQVPFLQLHKQKQAPLIISVPVIFRG